MSSVPDSRALTMNVCKQCKRRKKKCDKRLPICGRCKRLGIHCLYSSDVKDISGLSADPDINEVGRILPSHHHVATTLAAVPLPEMVSPFAFIASLPGCFQGSSLSGGEIRLLSLDEQLTMQACEVITRSGDDITSVCERFFKITEKWLPIIDKGEFFVRLLQLETSPNAPFSTLVMSICLYAHQSSRVLGRNSRAESLYYTTKCFYSLLHSNRRVSLDLLQAGILIAAYEHCQALYETSTLTIGICARMGYSFGLHRTIQPGAESLNIPKRELEERRRVWWGLFILERTMAIEHVESRIPFACHTPHIDQRLPSDSVRLGHDDAAVHPSDGYTPLSFELCSGTPVRLGPYPREAQAAYLLSQVLDHILDDNLEQEERQQQAEEFDNSLQSLLMAMLEPPRGYARGDYCGAYSICMSALICLHQSRLSKESWSSPVNDSSSRSLLAVEVASRMLLEACASSIIGPPLDWDTLPIWSIVSMYIAGLVRIKLSCGFPDKKRGESELAPALAYMQHFESRYRVAADHLEGIQTALVSYNG